MEVDSNRKATDFGPSCVFHLGLANSLARCLQDGVKGICVVAPPGAGVTYTIRRVASKLGMRRVCLHNLATRYEGVAWDRIPLPTSTTDPVLAVADPFVSGRAAETRAMVNMLQRSKVPIVLVLNASSFTLTGRSKGAVSSFIRTASKSRSVEIIRVQRDDARTIASKLACLFNIRREDESRVHLARACAESCAGNLTHAVTQMEFCSRFKGAQPCPIHSEMDIDGESNDKPSAPVFDAAMTSSAIADPKDLDAHQLDSMLMASCMGSDIDVMMASHLPAVVIQELRKWGEAPHWAKPSWATPSWVTKPSWARHQVPPLEQRELTARDCMNSKFE